MSKELSEMNGPELVAAYNSMLPAGGTHVKKFSSLKAGIRRCQELMVKNGSTVIPEDGTPKAKTKTARRKKASAARVTNRQKLKDALTAPVGKKRTREELCQALYGSSNKKYFGALNMVLKGLKVEIDKKTYPFILTRIKEDDDSICYQLAKTE